ncbi:MAG TPA: M48 family metallopeptidase [Phycisphaerales bacterium]|nr:M48 family metallopeptidase [Phycisphaerales bacterium]
MAMVTGSMRIVACAGALLAGGLLGACSTNPTTGRSQFNALSRDQEVQLGEQAKDELATEMGGRVTDATLAGYVDEIGRRLVETTYQDDASLRELPWEFILLDSDVVNAFALPGGKVFMSMGLARRMTNEAQLAAVLGHEIGHVTARHTNDRFARAAGTQLGVGVLAILLGDSGAPLADLGGQVAQIALLKYDRGQELESDALGMRYITRAGYDPRGARQVMEILATLERSGRAPEMLSTHPLPESRIRAIDERIAAEYPQTQNNPQFRLGEAEFRRRFLSRVTALFPEGRPEDPRVRSFAIAGGCGGACRDHAAAAASTR